MYRWQHVAPSARLHGIDGTLHVIRQLEGYEIPAAAWESTVLPARVAGYRREYLDGLCHSGDVMWGRLSAHPALHGSPASEAPERVRRIRPTKLAPIALITREDAESLIVRRPFDRDVLEPAARDVYDAIAASGAPFFADIVRTTKRLPAEIEEALWQLVAAGLVTADGFDALRALTDRRRRLGEKGERARPRSSSGRWTILRSETGAMSSRAKRSPRRGAICSAHSAAWRRAVKSAAAGSWRVTPANSSLAPRRSTRCGRPGATPTMPM